MRITIPLAATACAVLLAGPATVRAQYSSDVHPAPARSSAPPVYVYVPYFGGPLFVNADLGGSLLQNMNNRGGGPTLRFDAGSRFDVSFGCYVAEPLSLEFETGVIWNSVRHDNTLPITMNGLDADLYQVPLLLNMVYHVPLPGGGSAYFGAGAGGVATDLYITRPGHHHRDYTADTDISFAYQAMAGVKFPVARRMEVGVGYKFLGTLDHSWFDGDPTLFTQTGPAYSHSILASFTYKF